MIAPNEADNGGAARDFAHAARPHSPQRPPVAWSVLIALGLVKIALHVLSTTLPFYGYWVDEFYYLDCADHLAWGYVDHPPFSIAVLALVRATLGDSLMALRLLPALCGGAAVVLTGMIARELGGGRAAQGLSALALLIAPIVLYLGSFYSMNGLDVAIWALCAYALVRLLNGANSGWWLTLGVLLGVGLLNKLAMLWFGFGLLVGLVLTPARSWLRTPWPWLAAAIAALIVAPNVIWQVRHDWPTLEFMRTGMREVMVAKSPLAFVREQVQGMHPLTAPFWLAGLLYYFTAAGRPYRLLGWLWVSVFLLLLVSGSARPYYLTPAYPIVLGAGGVVVEHYSRRGGWRWLPAAVAAGLIVAGASSAPLGLPLLPPAPMVEYERVLGSERPPTEFDSGQLPVQLSFRLGWPELARAVADAYQALPRDEQAKAGVLAFTFGETGALNLLGRNLGLPPAIGTHNNYWLWGPRGYSGEVMLAVADSDAQLRQWFEQVEPARRVDCQYCMPELARQTVYVCRRPRRDLAELWPGLKNYR